MSINRRQLLTAGLYTGLSITLYPLVGHTKSKDNLVTHKQIVSGYAFGTEWHLSLHPQDRIEPAIEIIRTIVKSVDQSMSPYRRNSELCAFNRLSKDHTFDASDALSTVVQASLKVASLSSGAFDPTVGPIVSRYGFGPITGSNGDDSTCRYTDISQHRQTLKKTNSNATLDLCGIAKGYALDEINRCLSNAGYKNYLLELGGELVATGHPLDTGDSRKISWTIGVESLSSLSNSIFRTTLSNAAIATSGIAHNSYALRNKRYNHIINPQQQTVTSNSLYSVTVKHNSAMLADAWSTALYVMGEKKGSALAQKLNLSAMFLTDSTSGLQHSTTGQFDLITG